MATKRRRSEQVGILRQRESILMYGLRLEDFDGKMVTRKKEEAMASTQLNLFVSEELKRPRIYSEKMICNKLDFITRKGRQCKSATKVKGETGKKYTEDEADIDIEAAEKAWLNLKTFSADLGNIQPWVQVQWKNLVMLVSVMWQGLKRRTMPRLRAPDLQAGLHWRV